jgi:hypothetical protein
MLYKPLPATRQELIQKLKSRIDQQIDEIGRAICEGRGSARPMRLLEAFSRMLALEEDREQPDTGGLAE